MTFRTCVLSSSLRRRPPLTMAQSHRKPSSTPSLILVGGCCCVAATSVFVLLGTQNEPSTSCNNNNSWSLLGSRHSGSLADCEGKLPSAASLKSHAVPVSQRHGKSNYRAAAEHYYKTHGVLPRPKTTHATLPENNSERSKNILVVGDIHGCLDEVKLLHAKAVQENGGVPFRAVVSVGDLTAKGPKSVQVLKHFRNSENWYSVRGNNDDGTLKAAFGDDKRTNDEKYAFVNDLSDEEVEYMSELPYTIRIPASYLAIDKGKKDELDIRDTIIVHAGFITGRPIEEQDVPTMITIRGLQKLKKKDDPWEFYSFTRAKIMGVPTPVVGPILWAKTWKGPQRVLFGHDAPQGLQRYEGDWALGLDTGAVYGGELTGLILPKGKIVQVDALAEHENVGLWDRVARMGGGKKEGEQ